GGGGGGGAGGAGAGTERAGKFAQRPPIRTPEVCTLCQAPPPQQLCQKEGRTSPPPDAWPCVPVRRVRRAAYVVQRAMPTQGRWAGRRASKVAMSLSRCSVSPK